MTDEFNLPPKEVAKRLTQDQRLERIGTDVGLSPRQANAITKARLNLALSQLAEGNIDNVQTWLEQVGRVAPAEAIRLYMELMEFSTPRMKAAQVNVNADMTPAAGGARSLADMTIDELRIVAEG